MNIFTALNDSLGFLETVACRVCRAGKLDSIISLGRQPLANSLSENLDAPSMTAPLELVRCVECGAIQLGVDIDAPEMFSNYLWVTGTSDSSVAHCAWVASETLKRSKKSPESVLEIASNDGTLLKAFKNLGIEDVLGVDPAKNLAELARDEGIPTLENYFSHAVSSDITASRHKFDVAIARNVLSHVPDPGDLIQGMASALNSSGICVIEFHRVDIIMKELHYDSIYHEHSTYHSFQSMSRLLADSDLRVFDALESPISGGSWLIFAAHESEVKEVTAGIAKIRNDESDSGIASHQPWNVFASRVKSHKQEIVRFLESEAEESRRVVAFGASARSSTLLNYWSVGTSLIESIIDSNPMKQGMFSPGTGIPIVSPEVGLNSNPDTILLLAFNFQEEIKELIRRYGWSGRLASPLPSSLRIIEFS